ncbi:hypothetical protein TNIN_425781 [Trichonephila inaurata madagascariensis]|uniref:Uncharacterized protein n=1 Tax=Trichonephila inaurata madagascariensis TaxID=2747483 RepID=A0A8X6YMJ0_9ARAC|nr:hypothetical protein TNIN_425781 [Trichonephila inaurata madagascariensis]
MSLKYRFPICSDNFRGIPGAPGSGVRSPALAFRPAADRPATGGPAPRPEDSCSNPAFCVVPELDLQSDCVGQIVLPQRKVCAR